MDAAAPEAPTQPIMVLGQMLGRIAAMQRDQAETNQQFLGALQAQAERQARALEQLAARAAAAPPVTPPSPLAGVVLHKMSAAYDVQSFLDTFEATAEACSWPAAEWGVRLLPLVTGEAQTPALGLPPALHVRSAAEGRRSQVAATRESRGGRRKSWRRWSWSSLSGRCLPKRQLGSDITAPRPWGPPSPWQRTTWQFIPAARETVATRWRRPGRRRHLGEGCLRSCCRGPHWLRGRAPSSSLPRHRPLHPPALFPIHRGPRAPILMRQGWSVGGVGSPVTSGGNVR
ncbi:hypothetical protein VZT92_002029 [Zoarces viviparus]|uniref:Uncharacterized protein n=1 Tax=Zoarces viviparus TaxID=48416 RepID=A0AAW1G408_ZOAVI